MKEVAKLVWRGVLASAVIIKTELAMMRYETRAKLRNFFPHPSVLKRQDGRVVRSESGGKTTNAT